MTSKFALLFQSNGVYMYRLIFLQKSFYKTLSRFFVIFTMAVVHAFADLGYVTNSQDGNVSVFDTVSNTLLGPPINVGSVPFGIAITSDGNYVYVTNLIDNTVSVIDAIHQTVVGPPIAVGHFPSGIAITPDDRFLYVANANGGTVSVIATSSNTVVATIGCANHPQQLAVTPHGKFVYVPDFLTSVFVIETSSNNVVDIIGGFNAPYDIAITPDGRYAYVSNDGNSTVSLIDITTNTVISPTIVLEPDIVYLAITPDGKYMYAPNYGSSNVQVIEVATNTVVGPPIEVGVFPFAIAITLDGKYVYVADYFSGTVYLIATSSNTVIATPFSVGFEPPTIAIGPNPLQPKNFNGKRKTNDFGLVYELYNFLSWMPSPSQSTVGYYIYRNGVKIATLKATDLHYKDHNRKKGVSTLYSITGFDSSGVESTPVSIVITGRD